jgi:hypothetical protein
VEQRARIVEAEQRGLAGSALGEVVVVHDDRRDRLAAAPLRDCTRYELIQAPLRLLGRA